MAKKRASFFDEEEEDDSIEGNMPPGGEEMPTVSRETPAQGTDQLALMQQMMQTMQSMMAGGAMPGSGWASATPFQSSGLEPETTEDVAHDIIIPNTLDRGITKQVGLPVHPLYGKLFTNTDGSFLGGIPKGCTITLTGPSYTGKTRSALEMVIRAAMEGVKTAYVVAEEGFYDSNESGRNDLFSRFLELGVAITGMTEDAFRKKYDDLYVIIPNQYHLGKTWSDFIKDYRYVVEKLDVEFIVVDSINTLDPSKLNTVENLSSLKTYNHEKGITCLVIGQVKDSGQPQGGEQLFHTSEVSLHLFEMTMTSKALAETWGAEYRDSITLLSARSKVCSTLGFPVKVNYNEYGLIRADPHQPDTNDIPADFWDGME
ncbi:MAG: RAD55 family ATPase [Candidatus Kariarchaeaceae archaeon]|jgi:KaiC/GvpD/RAD55 family RecA-like ATPase